MFSIINSFLISLTVIQMDYLKSIACDGIVKFVSCILIGIFTWVLSTILPLLTTFGVVISLIFADALLRCKIARMKNIKWQSRKIFCTLKKLCWCLAIVWFAHMIDTEIFTSFDAHLVEFFAGTIAGVELWSIVESLSTIDPTGPWRIFKKFIKSKGEKYLDITIDRKDLPKIKELIKKIK